MQLFVLIILVCVKDVYKRQVLNRSGFDKDGTAVTEIGNGWGYYDLGLNNMALLLKATELGISNLVMGIRDGEKLRKEFDIPETDAVARQY